MPVLQDDIDSSSSSKSSSVVFVVMAITAVLAVVVLLLAVAWRRYPSISSLFDSLGNRRQRYVPSSVRHRLRLRLPAAAAAESSSISPISSTGWAPQMLAHQAKKMQLQQSRKDSGDGDDMKTGSRTVLSTSSRQQSCTPSDLIPVDCLDTMLTFFDRRLELLTDDDRLF